MDRPKEPSFDPTATVVVGLPRAAATALVALFALLATACGTSAATAHPNTPTTAPYRRAGYGPAQPTAQAIAEARATFRHDIAVAAAGFVADIGALQSAVDQGNDSTGRSAELAAQADYDHFRLLENDNTVNASTLDELASAVAPGQTFAGLHAVERDLWTWSGDAPMDVAAIAAQAPVAEYLLSKDVLDPEAIGTTGVAELGWTADWAVPGLEEQFSHLDTVDIAATVGAADEAFTSIAPLGSVVAPGLTTALQRAFGALASSIAALGPPTEVPDTAINDGERRSLTQQLDVAAAGMSRLAAALTPYGTSQPAAYPS